MDLMQADDILAEARKRKKDQARLEREAEIERLQGQVDLAKVKKATAKSQEERLRGLVGETVSKTIELGELKSFLKPEDYAGALAQYSAEVTKAKEGLALIELSIQELDDEISCKVVTLRQLREHSSCPERETRDPLAVPDEVLLPKCREEVKRTFQYCRFALPDLLGSLYPDNDRILLTCTVAAGNIRSMLTAVKDYNDHEKRILKRCLGCIGTQTGYYRCGLVDALQEANVRDWTEYTAVAKDRLVRLDEAARTLVKPRRKPEPERESEPAVVEIPHGLLDRVKGMKAGILGGIENPFLCKWMEKDLGFKRVAWYGCRGKEHEKGALVQSIGNNGVDILVIMTKSIAHKHSVPVTLLAKAKNVPVALCNSTGKQELVSAVSQALGTNGGKKQ